jgi:hypothetical protein
MPKADAFAATFAALHKILKPYARTFEVVVDKPGKYYLASKTAKTASGAAIWFGGVEIKKNYVSFHFVPIYANPALLKGVSPLLLKRKQGKGCFNFTVIEPAQIKELTKLTKRGFGGFMKQFP